MSSKLSSLLVQDGVVSVKRMEEAFQRQVIYGGELDTVLLEMGAVEEPVVCRYLHVATSLPPGDLSELELSELTKVAESFPQKLAEKYKVAPIRKEGDILQVVVAESAERTQLEELSFMLGLTLVPHVVPEVRLMQVLEAAYDFKLSRRHAGLLKKLGPTPALRPAGVPAKVLHAGVAEAAEEPGAEGAEEPAAKPGQKEAPPTAEPSEAEGRAEATPPADVWSSGDLGEAGAERARRPSSTVEADTLVGMPTASQPSAAGAPTAAEPEETAAEPEETLVETEPTEGAPAEEIEDRRTQIGMPVGPMPEELARAAQPAQPAEAAEPARTMAEEAATEGPAAEEELQTPLVAPPPPGEEAGEEEEYPKVIAPEFAREAKGVIEVGGGGEPAEKQPVGEGAKQLEKAISPFRKSGGGQAEPEDVGGVERKPGTFEPAEATEEFQQTQNRDEIFEVLLRTVGSRVRYAALFVVMGDHAAGRMAFEDGELRDHEISKIEIPLRSKSLFKTVVDTGSQYYGPVDDDGLNFSILTQMERLDAPNVLALPVTIRSRVVCIVYADAGDELLTPEPVADLAPVPFMAAAAFQRIIMEAKRKGYAAAQEAGSGRLEPSEEMTGKMPDGGAAEPQQWGSAQRDEQELKVAKRQTSPVAAEPASEAAAEVRLGGQIPDVLTPEGIEFLIEQMEQDGPAAERAADALVRAGDAAFEAIMARFPGKLVVDRFAPGAKLPPVSQHGPLLNFLVWRGDDSVGHVLPLLESEDAEKRFYATLLFTEIPADNAVGLLYQKLFDGEASIRRAAVDALRNCARGNRMTTVLEYLRGVLQQGVPFHRACAADAVGALRDSVSVPILISMVDDPSPQVAEAAQRALLLITKQAFGNRKGEWLAWWGRNGERSRIEWMIDALVHPDVECRFMAFQELKHLTGKDFGYRFDLPLKERHAAADRWREWWQTEGKARVQSSE
jgi:hypothetical protein